MTSALGAVKKELLNLSKQIISTRPTLGPFLWYSYTHEIVAHNHKKHTAERKAGEMQFFLADYCALSKEITFQRIQVLAPWHF